MEAKIESDFGVDKSEIRKAVEEAFFKQQEIFDKTYKEFNPMMFLSSKQGVQINAKYKWRIPKHG